MESRPPKDFNQFLINSDPGQNWSEKATRLLFPDYPNIPGDDEIPTDSPLMTLLRENLPSMRTASGAIRSQHRKEGKSKRGDRSRPDPDFTASKGSHSDVASLARDHDNENELLSDRIRELKTLVSATLDQKIAHNQAKRDHQRLLYTEKHAESQRQREHEMKMEAMKMEMEEKSMEYKKQTVESDIRKLQLEIELQQLKIQELEMKKGALSGRGDDNQ